MRATARPRRGSARRRWGSGGLPPGRTRGGAGGRKCNHPTTPISVSQAGAKYRESPNENRTRPAIDRARAGATARRGETPDGLLILVVRLVGDVQRRRRGKA